MGEECVCLCVFLLIIFFAIEQNNLALLAPACACAVKWF